MDDTLNSTFQIPVFTTVEDVQKAPVQAVNVSEARPTVQQNSSAASLNVKTLYEELSSISSEVIKCRNMALKNIS